MFPDPVQDEFTIGWKPGSPTQMGETLTTLTLVPVAKRAARAAACHGGRCPPYGSGAAGRPRTRRGRADVLAGLRLDVVHSSSSGGTDRRPGWNSSAYDRRSVVVAVANQSAGGGRPHGVDGAENTIRGQNQAHRADPRATSRHRSPVPCAVPPPRYGGEEVRLPVHQPGPQGAHDSRPARRGDQGLGLQVHRRSDPGADRRPRGQGRLARGGSQRLADRPFGFPASRLVPWKVLPIRRVHGIRRRGQARWSRSWSKTPDSSISRTMARSWCWSTVRKTVTAARGWNR